MKFYVDQTLGTLAKWLRLLGFDTEPIQLPPRGQARLPGRQPGVYFLSRQAAWAARQPRPDLLVLTASDVEGQCMEVCRRLQLTPETWQPLQRCSDCNEPLQTLPHDQAEGRVPDYIFAQHRDFRTCPRCRRVFWDGTHQRRIRQRWQELVQRAKTA